MYLPSAFRVEDETELFDFITAYSFATLVSTRNGVPLATHLPLLLDRERRLLLGHMARANPHWQALASAESLAIFHGPHAYISPTYYTTTPAVPTWNYTTVHVYGVAQLVDDATTARLVAQTVHHYEHARSMPWTGELPDDFRAKLLQGIVGFSLPLTRIEGKFKLGQNRGAADQASMFEHLTHGGPAEQDLAAFIQQRRR